MQLFNDQKGQEREEIDRPLNVIKEQNQIIKGQKGKKKQAKKDAV